MVKLRRAADIHLLARMSLVQDKPKRPTPDHILEAVTLAQDALADKWTHLHMDNTLLDIKAVPSRVESSGITASQYPRLYITCSLTAE
jgi:hypothetical protein